LINHITPPDKSNMLSTPCESLLGEKDPQFASQLRQSLRLQSEPENAIG
jgi:hypothetical protein